MKTRHARIRRPCNASRKTGCQSTFSPRDLSPPSCPFCTQHAALCIHETPIVPRFFALYRETKVFSRALPASTITGSYLSFRKSRRRPVTSSLPSQMSTFPSQVPDLTLFNLFYPHPNAPHSTSFHQKSPALPPIPLNSIYTVPPKSTQAPDFFVLLR